MCAAASPARPTFIPPRSANWRARLSVRTWPTRAARTAVATDGTYKFKGAVAAPFLVAAGAPANTLDDPSWQTNKPLADKVAAAVMEWARSKGASMVSHLAQPLGSAGVRRGQTLQVHNAMFNFGKNGKPEWVFTSDELLKGETDGSSYMNGSLRCTHEAGGYTALDPSSPMFVRGDTLFIPTIFVSFYGKALDEKTPLLRSMEACSKAGVRLLKLLGYNCKTVLPMIGLEQEFFLVPRSAYFKRPDLQLAGRTVMGAMPARGQVTPGPRPCAPAHPRTPARPHVFARPRALTPSRPHTPHATTSCAGAALGAIALAGALGPPRVAAPRSIAAASLTRVCLVGACVYACVRRSCRITTCPRSMWRPSSV